MATIKSLLSDALDSHLKSEKKWVGKQAFRCKSFIAIVPYPGTAGQVDVNYVPPCDGWAMADDNGSDSDLYIQGEFLVYSGKTSGSCRRAIYTRVTKGGGVPYRWQSIRRRLHHVRSAGIARIKSVMEVSYG